MKIQKGDQYAIPIALSFNGQNVAPADIDDVRIQIGDELRQYSDGTLTYDSVGKVWLFTVTEEQTRAMGNQTGFQSAIKIGEDIYHSDVSIINVRESLITEE